jgi:hypothetical protein
MRLPAAEPALQVQERAGEERAARTVRWLGARAAGRGEAGRGGCKGPAGGAVCYRWAIGPQIPLWQDLDMVLWQAKLAEPALQVHEFCVKHTSPPFAAAALSFPPVPIQAAEQSGQNQF